MSREVARTTAKSKTELPATKYKGQPLICVTESPTPNSTRVLDTLRYFLKLVSAIFYQIFTVSPIDSPSKTF